MTRPDPEQRPLILSVRNPSSSESGHTVALRGFSMAVVHVLLTDSMTDGELEQVREGLKEFFDEIAEDLADETGRPVEEFRPDIE